MISLIQFSYNGEYTTGSFLFLIFNFEFNYHWDFVHLLVWQFGNRCLIVITYSRISDIVDLILILDCVGFQSSYVDTLKHNVVPGNCNSAINMYISHREGSNVSILQFGWIFYLNHGLIPNIVIFKLSTSILSPISVVDYCLSPQS